MGKKLAIENHLIRPNEVIELLEMMGGKNKDNADGCSFLYYTLCTPKINNPNNEKVICGFTNLKMQNDFFAIFTLEKFWKKYPYKLNDKVLCDDGLLGVVTKMEWDCEKSDMKYYISFKIPVDNKWYNSKNIKCKYYMEVKGKKLAIKGHPTRGKEVIELLEMLGGINDEGHIGTNTWKDVYYYLDNGHIRAYDWCDAIKFTLEGFWEKYPFKVGDKVIDEADGCPGVVCEMKWDEGLSDMKYCVAFGNGIDFGWFANDSINFFKIKKNENLEEIQSKRECDELRMPLNDNENKFPSFEPMFKMNDELEYKIPDGYEITEVSKDKVFIKPIKSKYPNTYEECVRIAKNIHGYDIHIDVPAYGELMESFVKLLICRDAYWKIAGEELELGKPWKPDWLSGRNEEKYCIATQNNEIWHNFSEYGGNEILAFPTIEMRDAFYENFKKEIEQCKELL